MERVLNIGIDASKKMLEIAPEDQKKTEQVVNTRASIGKWLAGLSKPCRIGIESTGRCHQLLVQCAISAGHTVYVLNPNDLSHYLRSLGRRAKTDRLDAQGIVRYLAKEHEELHPYQLPSTVQLQMGDLISRRRKVVEMQGTVRQSFSEVSCKLKKLPKLQRMFKELIKEIDDNMASLVSSDTELARHAKNLKTVPGYGPLISRVMAHTLSCRSFTHSDAVVAYVGYDPRVRDSGQLKGRRVLTKRGPAELRRLLYVAAMAASKTRLWRPIYERYRARGLASTATLVILARKLIRIAFSIVKYGTVFKPELLQENACTKP